MQIKPFGACIGTVILALQSYAQITGPIEYTFEAEYFSEMQGATLPAPVDKEPCATVKDCGNGDWIRYDSVSFLDGEYDSLALYYFTGWPQDVSNATVSLRIDSPTGTVISTVRGLGSQRAIWGEPGKYLMAPMSRTTGFHTVYLTFSGADDICDVDKLRFVGRMTAGPDDARTYYVSSAGDDGNDGLSIDRPFRTIQKAASLMKPGSRCLIRQGIYRETVRPAYTGIAGASLSFEAYNGENVVISGADPITGWTVHSGSIYKAPMPSSIGKYRNQVLVNGAMAWAARCPNVDEDYTPHPWQAWCGSGLFNWREWQSRAEPIAYPTRICIGENSSHGTPPLSTTALYDYDISQVQSDWTAHQIPTAMLNQPADFLQGGLVTVHNLWWSTLGEIASSQSESPTKTVINSTIYQGGYDGSGPGWVSHVLGLLDAPNEWFRDSASQTLYLWAPDGGDPSQHLVEAKKRTLGFDLRGKQYVNLTGLHFLATSLTMADANNCVVDRCAFRYISHYDDFQWYESGAFWNSPFDPSPGYTGVFVSGYNNIIRNSLFRGSAGSGVILNGHHNTVTNCIIHSCDYAATYQAGVLVMKRYSFEHDGYALTISNNTMQHNGRFNVEVKAASSTPQDRVRIEYNDFGPSGYLLKESASVSGQTGRVEVSHNYFHGEGCRDGGDILPEGDMGGTGWIIHHNVFWQGETPQAPLQIVGSHWCLMGDDTEMRIFNNTVVDSCAPGTRDRDTGLAIWYLNNNTIYARSDTVPWMFANPLERDYALREGSPAIDAGVVIPGWVEDYEGSAPDMGAFEYGRPPWVAGADWEEQTWVYPPDDFLVGRDIGAFPREHLFSVNVLRKGGMLLLKGPAGMNRIVTVFDARGKMIARARWGKGRGTLALDTREWSSRVYVIKVVSGSGWEVKKLCAVR